MKLHVSIVIDEVALRRLHCTEGYITKFKDDLRNEVEASLDSVLKYRKLHWPWWRRQVRVL